MSFWGQNKETEMMCGTRLVSRTSGIILSLLAFFSTGQRLCSAAFGQTPTPTTPPTKYSTPPVQWDLKPGEPIRMKFLDGREIVVKQSLLKPEWVSIPFRIYENTCQPQNIGQKGEHRIQVLAVKVALVWSQHPDPTKIGQVVKIKSFDGSLVPLDTIDFLPPSAFGKMPELSKLTEAEELQMDDFSWLPGHAEKSAPDGLYIVRWEGEVMLDNAETSTTENRPLQGYAGVHLEKKSDRALRVTHIEQLLAVFSNAFPLGDVVSMSIYDQRKVLCQIAAKIDQGPLVREVRRIQAERATTDQILIYGRDSILALWQHLESFQLSTLTPERLYSPVSENANGVLTTSFVLAEVY